MWFAVAPRTDTKKTCLKEIGFRVQNMLTILCSLTIHVRSENHVESDHQQCSRLKSSMHVKHNSPLQNIPLSKQPFKTQPQIEKEGVT